MIVLSVLKVIGLILLIILCILAILVALVLLFPVQYDATGSTEKKTAALRLRWLAGILTFRAFYRDGDSDYGVFLFGVRLKKPEERQKKKRRRKKKKNQKKPEPAASSQMRGADEDRSAKQKSEEIRSEIRTEKTLHSSSGDSRYQKERRRNAPGRKWRKKRFYRPVVHRFQRIIGIIKKVVRVIRTLVEEEILHYILPRLGRLLYRIRPRVLTGEAEFGFDDPAVTGLVCGGIAAVPALLGTGLKICPDFETEKTYFRGEVFLKGRILILWVVVFVIAMMRKKEIRRAIGSIMKR